MGSLSISIFIATIALLASSCQGVLYITLTFDDGYYSHMNASLVLDQFHFNSTFFVNSGRFNINRMGKGALLDIQSRGHEIAGHTIDHSNLIPLTDAQRRFQICQDRLNLIGMGFTITNFAYPFGSNFPGSPGMIYDCNYTSARDSGGIKVSDGCRKCLPSLILPIPNGQIYLLPSIVFNNQNMTLPDLMRYIDNALYFSQYDDKWLIFTLHDIVEPPYTDVKQMDFETFIGLVLYIQSYVDTGAVKVATVREVVDLYRSDYVPAPGESASTAQTTDTPSPTSATSLTPPTTSASGSGGITRAPNVIVILLCVFVLAAYLAKLL